MFFYTSPSFISFYLCKLLLTILIPVVSVLFLCILTVLTHLSNPLFLYSRSSNLTSLDNGLSSKRHELIILRSQNDLFYSICLSLNNCTMKKICQKALQLSCFPLCWQMFLFDASIDSATILYLRGNKF